ncbi:MAG: hypothetical protein M5T61_03275 [Acidimicrobiia bacterium]|nr:hypothetical protein [Acidimicrobiia bacterium]
MLGACDVQLGSAMRSRLQAARMSQVLGRVCWNRTMVWRPVWRDGRGGVESAATESFGFSDGERADEAQAL